MGSEPTEILKDGIQYWHINDKLHREDGPARIYPDGSEEWYINDVLHREDGPAVIDEGESPNKVWYIHGKIHRLDGPAVIWEVSGERQWYINGHYVTDQITEWAKDRDIDLNNLTEMDKMIIQLEWGNYGK